MKRLHVHVSVEDLDQGIRFYSTMFASQPTVLESDYAKWLLDDPQVNFAISTRCADAGLSHLGIQVESDAELADIGDRLHAAGETLIEQKEITCCYATGNKAWVEDPAGINWETFHTLGSDTVYGTDDMSGKVRAPKAFEGGDCAPTKGSCCG